MGAAADPGTPRAELLPELAAIPGHMFWRASARVEQALAEVLPEGVDVHAYAVLTALGDGAARSQQWLADTIAVSRTTMTRIGSDLAARGLVERVRNPADRRSYALTQTAEGAAAAAAWRPHVQAARTRLLAGLSTHEQQELHRLLLVVATPILATALLPDLPASAGFLLNRLHAHLHAEITVALRDLHLEPRHLGTLTVLTSLGPVAQAELARHLGISGASVVEIVDHLEARRLLERRRLPADRRTQILHLVPDADTVVLEAHRRGRAVTAATLTELTPAELDQLLVLLGRVVADA